MEEYKQRFWMAACEGAKWVALATDREIMDEKGIDRNLLAPRTLMASI